MHLEALGRLGSVNPSAGDRSNSVIAFWRPAGWLASQQKVPPSPGLIIISTIIIVMIVKLLIISSISTISFIQICNMNDINNIYALTINGFAIMINPYDVVIDVIHVADMDEA